MSQAMELLWKTKSKVKALRLLKMDFVCSPKMHGGLNILNLRYHMLKATLLTTFFFPTTALGNYVSNYVLYYEIIGVWQLDH